MSTLITLIANLILIIIGFAFVSLTAVLLLLIAYAAYKTARIQIAMIQAAISEPENKIVDKVRRLSKKVKPVIPLKTVTAKTNKRGMK